jgi:hypothetical protein
MRLDGGNGSRPSNSKDGPNFATTTGVAAEIHRYLAALFAIRRIACATIGGGQLPLRRFPPSAELHREG